MAEKLPLDYAGAESHRGTSIRTRLSRSTCVASVCCVATGEIGRRLHIAAAFFGMIYFGVIIVLVMFIPFVFGVVLPVLFPTTVPDDFGLPRREWLEIAAETAIVGLAAVIGPIYYRRV